MENSNFVTQESDKKIKIDENKQAGIKTVYQGTKRFKNIDTGEIIELDYIEKKVNHTLNRGWRRVYLEQFLELLTGLYTSGKKLTIVEFILNNLNSENQLTLSQSEVIKQTKSSSTTVVETYKYLIDINFMRKTGLCYTINPRFVCAFGSDKKNAKILISYEDAEPTLFDENGNANV